MIQVNEPMTTARIQKALGRIRSITAPDTIEAAVQENSRKAAQNTPFYSLYVYPQYFSLKQ
jgi:hypothetical protein